MSRVNIRIDICAWSSAPTINESEFDFRMACCSGSTIYAIIINTMEMTISCTDDDDSDNGDNNSHQVDVMCHTYPICDMRYAENDIIC